ncbi:hypothetical protein O1611_g2009 [Lasiodiplodia mahajangana]|uniref:Uncharacterized protein n=1 Tax=Lasiodiplodia mahajangana TaxID=1108764 RepID=A0ACC2JVX2_9PEZI|nr:hypothetical protein O1611_g2009 [Lasiodiplodia mahajangana]
MSDISVDGDYDGPFETKPTLDGKGIGAFATRDINAGEVVLVTYTSIILNEGILNDECDQIAAIYEALNPEDKNEWKSLSMHVTKERQEKYYRGFSRLNPDGSKKFGDEEQVQLYTALRMQLRSNSFGVNLDEPEEARDLANGNEPIAGTVGEILPEFDDSIPGTQRYLARRLNLLRELHEASQKPEEKACYQKELVFVLWENQQFYYVAHSDSKNDDGTHTDVSLALLRKAIGLGEEALARARTVWPETHQMVWMTISDLRSWQVWEG